MENVATESNSLQSSKRKRVFGWLLLLLLTIAAVAIVLIPVFVIVPFKAQTDRGVAVSYYLRSWSPLLTFVFSLVGLAMVVWLWRGVRWWKRPFLVLLMLPMLAVTWLARQNHFEWMFNPLKDSSYARLSEAGFVNDKEMVMSVNLNGEAAAYPVRFMAYHHVLQDTVGGVPIVATY